MVTDILILMAEHGPGYKASIARGLNISAETVVSALKILEDNELIVRVAPGNVLEKRANLQGPKSEWYGLTDKGRQVAIATKNYRMWLMNLLKSDMVAFVPYIVAGILATFLI